MNTLFYTAPKRNVRKNPYFNKGLGKRHSINFEVIQQDLLDGGQRGRFVKCPFTFLCVNVF